MAKIPKHGRKEGQVAKSIGLHSYASSVPLGNTDPTMVQGTLRGHGGVPNAPGRSTGRLRTYRGKYTR